MERYFTKFVCVQYWNILGKLYENMVTFVMQCPCGLVSGAAFSSFGCYFVNCSKQPLFQKFIAN